MKAKALLATRKAAKAVGAKNYQGKPCKRGHAEGRMTSNGGCLVCLRALAAETWKASREAILGTYVPAPAYVPAPDPFGLCRPLPKAKRIRRQPGSAGVGLD